MGSKNISQRKGVWAELQVVQLLTRRKWQLVSYRTKINKVEIDIVLKKSNSLLVGEVKYLDSDWRAFERMSDSQVQKIKKTVLYLRKNEPRYQICAYLFFVNAKAQVRFINLDDLF